MHNSTLANENTSLALDLNSSKSANAVLERSNETQKFELSVLADRALKDEEANSEISVTNVHLTAETGLLKSGRDELEAEVAQLRSTVAELSTELKQVRDGELVSFRADLETREQAYTSAASELASLRSEGAQLRARVSDLDAINERLDSEKKALDSRVSLLDRWINGYLADINCLKKENTTILEKLTAARDANARSAASNEYLAKQDLGLKANDDPIPQPGAEIDDEPLIGSCRGSLGVCESMHVRRYTPGFEINARFFQSLRACTKGSEADMVCGECKAVGLVPDCRTGRRRFEATELWPLEADSGVQNLRDVEWSVRDIDFRGADVKDEKALVADAGLVYEKVNKDVDVSLLSSLTNIHTPHCDSTDGKSQERSSNRRQRPLWRGQRGIGKTNLSQKTCRRR